MLISKFDLYKSEWLDLVFSDRNKAYGAYELRQHNSRVMLQALGAMIGSIIVVAFVFGVILKPAIQPKPPVLQIIPVNTVVLPPPPVQPVKPAEAKLPKMPKAPPAAPASQAPTIRFVPPVVTSDALAQNLPKVSDMGNKDIGPIDAKGIPGASPAIDKGNGDGPPASPTDDGLYNTGMGLQREPEPFGGFAAFGKFLEKHLRYPSEASDAHIQGKVFLSFIVEKDGSLSNITVLRGPGYGTNEEALRVLKLAPAWKPGIQNDHPVRVQYNIPINFQMPDDGN